MQQPDNSNNQNQEAPADAIAAFASKSTTPLESARQWVRLGFHPISISRETKRPNRKGWPSLRLTEAELPDNFNDDVNVGILLGDESGSADVDLDCREAIQAAPRLLPPTGIVFGRASKQASHYIYRLSPATTTKQYKDPFDGSMLVELRCRTKKDTCPQTVVPYSIHVSGEQIRFDRGLGQVATLKGDDLNAAVAKVAAASLLAKYWPAQQRNVTELALAGSLAHAGWNVDDAVAFIRATYESVRSHDPIALDRVKNSVRNTFEQYLAGAEVTGVPTLKEHIEGKAVDQALKWLGVALEPAKGVVVIPPNEPWRSQLIMSDGPHPYIFQIMANVAITLRHAEEWKDTIAYNEFARKAIFVKDAPAHLECKAGPIEDQQILWVLEVMQHADYPGIGKQCVTDALYAVAMEQGRRFHPVRDYLAKLAPWDKVPRLDQWLHTYLGAADNDISRMIGPKFLISMVARVMQPGCKADYAIVLESPQGEGKSSALRDGLMPDPGWFTDELPDLGSKDADMQIQGIWLVEAAEMDVMSRAEVSRIKAYLTRRVDRLRPPYGRTVVEFPRQTVFVGTANKTEYLKDETGGRRFWPVAVGSWGVGPIDTKALAKDRDQLWAETLFRYRANERWWPTMEEDKLLAVEQSARYEESAWTDVVMAWCDCPEAKATRWSEDEQRQVPLEIVSTSARVSLAEILVHGLGKPIGTVQRRDEMTVAHILTSKGWDRKRALVGKSRPWLYVRPEGQASPEPKSQQQLIKGEVPF